MAVPQNLQRQQRVRNARQSEVAGYALHQELTLSVYEQTANEWLRTALMQMEPFIRIMANDLASALTDGRFKNQFSTGTSRGVLDTGARARTEEVLFGIPFSAPGVQRPIYGYLHTDQDGLLGKNDVFLSFYGKIVVRLATSVKSRATFVVGDSLEDTQTGTLPTLAPTLVEEPSWLSLSSAQGDVLDYPNVEALLKDIDNPFNEIGYVEAQYHEAVTPADIVEVVFLRAEPVPILRSLLEQATIPWRRVQWM